MFINLIQNLKLNEAKCSVKTETLNFKMLLSTKMNQNSLSHNLSFFNLVNAKIQNLFLIKSPHKFLQENQMLFNNFARKLNFLKNKPLKKNNYPHTIQP